MWVERSLKGEYICVQRRDIIRGRKVKKERKKDGRSAFNLLSLKQL